jgi:hypothetical protein
VALRSPGRWLDSVRSPLFVFEGTDEPGNLDALRAMARRSPNRLIQFLAVPGVNHFRILAPANERVAAKILRDDGPTMSSAFTEADLSEIGKRL